MSDGIIQETFNQFRAKRLGKSITHSETLTLERELIEKIKQNAPTQKTHSGNFNDDYCISINHFIRKLIGDNHD